MMSKIQDMEGRIEEVEDRENSRLREKRTASLSEWENLKAETAGSRSSDNIYHRYQCTRST